jgi:ABC-type polar amino acid transport system ATPase subunit|tara:strand:+ start:32 stop:271 length:240 start_codon:yes stop_codon:yes gene_type:complete
MGLSSSIASNYYPHHYTGKQKERTKMNRELKMKVHLMIENATQALKRYDKDDDHWKTCLSLLRHDAKEFIRIFEEGEKQ